jgi:hypothetical protein
MLDHDVPELVLWRKVLNLTVAQLAHEHQLARTLGPKNAIASTMNEAQALVQKQEDAVREREDCIGEERASSAEDADWVCGGASTPDSRCRRGWETLKRSIVGAHVLGDEVGVGYLDLFGARRTQ